jgi:glycosyltransferase involved in cell wall biosynthesis
MPTATPTADPLRLAFIADPNSVHTRRWITFFAEAGHDVHLLDGFGATVAPDLHPRISVDRYEAFPAPRVPLLSMARGRRQLRRLLAELRPDVLHALFVRRYGWQAASSGFHPLVVTPWGSDLLVQSLRTPRVKRWDRRALRNADLVTFLSSTLRDAAIGAGANPDRMVGIQEGVDTRRFSPGSSGPELAARLGLEAGALDARRVVFSPRSIRPLYRQELILAAFARLPGDETALLMSARDADPAYLAELRRQAERLGVADRLVVVDDLTSDDMVDCLRLARVVVSVPSSDGRPVSVLEAMAVGAPPVVGSLPPLREMLGDVAPELIIDPLDEYTLAQAMDRFLNLPDAERQRLGESLREEVVRTSDWTANMTRMEQLYRDLAARRRPER